MKTTIDLPDPLYKRARIHAVEHATTLRAIVIESLQRHLKNQTNPGVSGTRNGVPLLPLFEREAPDRGGSQQIEGRTGYLVSGLI